MNTKTLHHLATKNNVSEETVTALWVEFKNHQNKQTFGQKFTTFATITSDLHTRIQVREEVIRNTLNKFPYFANIDLPMLTTSHVLIAVKQAGEVHRIENLPEGFQLKYQDELHFIAPKGNGQRPVPVHVPANQLWNDPVAVAVATRKAVRKAQKVKAEEEKKTISTKVQMLKNDMKKIETQLAQAEKDERKFARQLADPWDKNLERLNATELIGAGNVSRLKKVLRTSQELRWGKPGVFLGEEPDSIRLEWFKSSHSATFEIKKDGSMFAFYNNDDGVTVSAEPTTVNEALVFFDTYLG